MKVFLIRSQLAPPPRMSLAMLPTFSGMPGSSEVIEAADGSADGRGKLLALAKHPSPPPKICGAFTADDLSLALGLENAIHAVLLAGGRADRWTLEVERLAGFRPLRPSHWEVSGGEGEPAGALPPGAS